MYGRKVVGERIEGQKNAKKCRAEMATSGFLLTLIGSEV